MDEQRWNKLPRWVQSEFAERNRELDDLRRQLANLQAAHEVLEHRLWFVLTGPTEHDVQIGDKVRHLWCLDFDRPFAVCSIGPGDVLLIGRAIK